MPGQAGYRAVVVLPEKAWPVGAKQVAGPLAPVGRRYALMAAYAAPRPDWVRVEPHVIVVPEGVEARPGFYVAEGVVVLARYSGLREVFVEAVKAGLVPRFHLAGWGVPVIIADRLAEADEGLRRVLAALGAGRLLAWLRGVAEKVKVEGAPPRLVGAGRRGVAEGERGRG